MECEQARARVNKKTGSTGRNDVKHMVLGGKMECHILVVLLAFVVKRHQEGTCSKGSIDISVIHKLPGN